jgi:hypothetical protein
MALSNLRLGSLQTWQCGLDNWKVHLTNW